MNKIDPSIRCPSCQGKLYPRLLVCDTCGIKVEGNFNENEFNTLNPEELHFLRIFIQCEGRISDIETTLGISYPTVKSLITALKEKLGLGVVKQDTEKKGVTPEKTELRNTTDGKSESTEILDRLEKGEIKYKDALRLLRSAKKPKS